MLELVYQFMHGAFTEGKLKVVYTKRILADPQSVATGAFKFTPNPALHRGLSIR